MKRISSFLIALALTAAMVGCNGGGESCALTIGSTEGGSVNTPGEGTFTYSEGAVVDLVAEADEGYVFVNWTGDVSVINDVNSAATNITMNGDHHITANFGLEIRTWYNLDAVRTCLDGHHTLMNDLDSTTAGYDELAGPAANDGQGWQPIGYRTFDGSELWIGEGFEGTLDGQEHQILDLYINRPEENGIGLFGWVMERGAIKDIGVANVTVIGARCCNGGLVGVNLGTVSNSYSMGSVTGGTDVGGLVGVNGYSSGLVNNCHAAGNVTGGQAVGGLVGRSAGTVSNSYSVGYVTGQSWVGGLVGDAEGTINNSYYNYDEVMINGENVITVGALFDEDFEEWLANGRFLNINARLSQEDGYYLINDVSDLKQLLAFGQDGSLKFRLTSDLDLATDPNFYIPYLAGEFDGNGHTISNLSFSFSFVSQVGLFGYLAAGGKVSEVGAENTNLIGDWCVGGLVGLNNGVVSNSYSTGNVTGDWVDVGGLVGANGGTISNCYSTSSVTGHDTVGGLAGYNAYGCLVSNCYSSGSVNGDDHVGGLVGNNAGTVSNSFWDIETSGQATSDGGTGKTTAGMQNISTFSGATWDIVAVANLGIRNPAYIWNIVDSVTYPFLSWQLAI